MAQAAWEKTGTISAPAAARPAERLKFLVGGLLILGAVLYLIGSGTATGARYFITIEELVSKPEYIGQTVRVSGAVLGDTIQYDSRALTLNFTVANIPSEIGDLATVLHEAVSNPQAARIPVYIENQVKPDLLKHEAQAILTGKLGEDGIFYASELLLKCPSRYEESVPDQAA
jgi:cytochrome c-type biogenesis protein CcmE